MKSLLRKYSYYGSGGVKAAGGMAIIFCRAQESKRMNCIAEAFSEICDLAFRVGVRNMCELPGCWEFQVDEHWWIALNPHNKPTQCSQGFNVQAFEAYVMFNGWPAGVIGPRGGIIAAGELANEQTFIEALKASHREHKTSLAGVK